jgi:hypothetical protein
MSDLEQRKADTLQWMRNLREGKTAMQYSVGTAPIFPQEGEKILYAIPGVTMMEPRSVRVSSGSYGGPSIRIAKGVSFRVGKYGSTSRYHSEIRKIDTGTLTITTGRIVFSGGMKTINADFPKLIEIEAFDDGVALRRTTSQKTQYFMWPKKDTMFTFNIEGRTYTEPFTGIVLQYLMQGLMHK